MVKVLATILVATWLLQSCASTEEASGPDPSLGCAKPAALIANTAPASNKVRVGVTGALAEAAHYLADGEGYFAAQGVSVQLINFTSPSRMVPALASGQLDVGSGSIGPGLFNAAQNNLCIKIAGPLSRQEPGASGVFLFLRRELAESGAVRDFADLRGLHVGIPGRDNTSEYALAKMLQAGGLSAKDVQVLQMSYPTMLVSLANRSLDAAIMPEAVATSAADKNLGVKWKAVADVLPGAEFGVLLFSPHFATQQDVAVRWMAGYLQGARDYDAAFFHNLRRGEIVAQLTKASPMKDAHMYDELGFAVIDPNGRLNLDSVSDQLNWFVETGELRQPVDLSRVVDTSYVEAALERLGPYQ